MSPLDYDPDWESEEEIRERRHKEVLKAIEKNGGDDWGQLGGLIALAAGLWLLKGLGFF